MPDDRLSILFVCLGNICRSPLAEGIFLHKINERGVADRFRVDSAGTGAWHVGEPADPRAQKVAKKHGIALPSRGRQVGKRDIQQFDYLIAMDEANAEHLLRMGARPERVKLLLDFDEATHLREVPDPYYGGPDGFETVFNVVERACEALLDKLLTVRS